MVLGGLSGPPFEPLDLAEVCLLFFKTALLLALFSAKTVGDLCTLFVHSLCMSLGENGGLVHLWPNPAFQPKAITFFQSRVIRSSAPLRKVAAGAWLRMLCPVRALRC